MRTPLTLSFENDQCGQTLYYALRWEDTRGEKAKNPPVATSKARKCRNS